MLHGAANADGRYTKTLADAEAYIKKYQWGADGSVDAANVAYGGAGYGRSKRPDLSNTSFFLDALKAAGEDADSEAMQRGRRLRRTIFLRDARSRSATVTSSASPAAWPSVSLTVLKSSRSRNMTAGALSSRA